MKKGRGFVVAAAAAIAPMVVGVATPGIASAANSGNPNFAGYEFQSFVAVPATVSATIVVPTLKCTTGPERDIWPGVGLASVSAFAGMDIFCKNNKAHYSPYLEVQGHAKVFAADTAHPGDKIEFKVTQSTSQTTDSVIDATHAFTATSSGTGSGSGSGVMVGARPVYLGSGKLGIPNFGTITFSHALANGSTSTPGPFGALGPTAYNMIAGSGGSPPTTVQVLTNPFASNKESFKTVWKHS